MTPRPKLRILFPPGDVELAFDPATPIDLSATGGTPPYTWMVDGLPLPSQPVTARPAWTATGAGFAHLTVTDRDGTSASADVRLVAD
jgi:penicillin-binding protein 1C